MHRWISNLGPQSRHCLDVTRLSNTRAAPSPKCSPEFIGGEGSSAPRGCIVACGLQSCDHHPPTGRHQSQRRTSLPISPWLTWSGLLFLLFLEIGGNWKGFPSAQPRSLNPSSPRPVLSQYVTLGQFQEQSPRCRFFPASLACFSLQIRPSPADKISRPLSSFTRGSLTVLSDFFLTSS